MLRRAHLLRSSEEGKDDIFTLLKIHMETHIFKLIILKCQYCFTSPKFKLSEGYEVTTSPQKPELSPLLNRGIPLIN